MSQSPNEGYERTDAHARPLLVFAACLTVLVVVAMVAAHYLDRSLERAEARADERERHPMRPFRVGPADPVLQTVPTDELRAYRAQEQALLTSYGWVDRDNAIARIPIERAMELVARRGLPDYRSAVPEAPADAPPEDQDR